MRVVYCFSYLSFYTGVMYVHRPYFHYKFAYLPNMLVLNTCCCVLRPYKCQNEQDELNKVVTYKYVQSNYS